MDEETDPFLLLTTFEPGEWPNIPRPLLLLVICMQRCISLSHDRVEQVGVKCLQVAEENRKKIREVDCLFPILKNSISALEASFNEKVENAKFKATEDLNIFKTGLTKDLDFKQKSTDVKINSIQEQVFALKKTVNTLPFLQEIENLVRDSCSSLRKSLKKEIHDYMVAPEISSINTKIRESKEYSETYLTRIQEMMELYGTSIKVLNEQFNEKFVSFERFLNNCDKEFREMAVKNESVVASLSNDLQGIELKWENKQKKTISGLKTFQDKLAEMDQGTKGFVAELKNLKIKQDLALKESLKIVEAVNLIQLENKNNMILKNQRREQKLAEIKRKEEEELAKNQEIEVMTGSEKDLGIEKNDAVDIKNSKEKFEEIEKTRVENVEEKKSEHLQEKPKLLIKITSPVPEQSLGDSTLSLTPGEILKPLDIAPNLLSNSFFAHAAGSFTESNQEDLSLVVQQVKLLESKVSETREDFYKFQDKVQVERLETSFILKEMSDKFQWFPMSLSEIKGKSPSDARLYTLEARLRMEENTRVDQFNHLLSTINHLKFDYFCAEPPQVSQVFQGPKRRGTAKTGEKRTSRESLQSIDQVRKPDTRIKFDMKSEQFKTSTRRMSLDSDRTPRNMMFHKVPHLTSN